MPKVSIIIPAYNAGEFLAEAIDSALSQTFVDYEILVVDDGSTDNTRKVAESFGDRIRYIWQENAGQATAQNVGIMNTTASYIAFLDADDLWAADKLEKQVRILDEQPDVSLVYTDFYRGMKPWEDLGSMLERSGDGQLADPFFGLIKHNYIATPCVLLRRSALARAGLFDPTLLGSQGYDLWLRIARTGELRCVNEVLVFCRLHGTNVTKSLRYKRHQIKCRLLSWARWNHEPEVARELKCQLRELYVGLAHHARKEGFFSEARSAYWQSFKWGNRTLSCLVRLMTFSLPEGLLRTVLGVTGRSPVQPARPNDVAPITPMIPYDGSSDVSCADASSADAGC